MIARRLARCGLLAVMLTSACGGGDASEDATTDGESSADETVTGDAAGTESTGASGDGSSGDGDGSSGDGDVSTLLLGRALDLLKEEQDGKLQARLY